MTLSFVIEVARVEQLAIECAGLKQLGQATDLVVVGACGSSAHMPSREHAAIAPRYLRLRADTEITVCNTTQDERCVTRHRLFDRQVAIMLAGGLLPWLREQNEKPTT